MSGANNHTATIAEPKKSFSAYFRERATQQASAKLSQEGKTLLETLDIPTKKWEAWRYTSLKGIVESGYAQAKEASIEDISGFLIPGLEADMLVFLNGSYQAQLSHIQGNSNVSVSALSELSSEAQSFFEAKAGEILDSEENYFSALNAAYTNDGVLVHVSKNAQVERPIHILNLAQAASEGSSAYQTRNLFFAETGSNVQIIESHRSIGEGASFQNQVTEIFVGANAHLEYIKLQQENEHSSQISQTEIHQGNDSNCSIFTLTFSGKLIRNNLKVRLKGQNVESHLMGAYLLDGDQHLDNHTEVDHEEPNSFSNELYKGIIHEKATAVFNGKIHVFPDAQKTNAFQSNRNILLSNTANIYTKPQLEIYADDVKCSHGATTGRLDKDAMFYLQARGIAKEEARKLLIYAFATEVSDHISNDHVKEYVAKLIQEKY